MLVFAQTRWQMYAWDEVSIAFASCLCLWMDRQEVECKEKSMPGSSLKELAQSLLSDASKGPSAGIKEEEASLVPASTGDGLDREEVMGGWSEVQKDGARDPELDRAAEENAPRAEACGGMEVEPHETARGNTPVSRSLKRTHRTESRCQENKREYSLAGQQRVARRGYVLWSHMCMITTVARCKEDVRSCSGKFQGCGEEQAEKTTTSSPVVPRCVADEKTVAAVVENVSRGSAATTITKCIKEGSDGEVVVEEQRRDSSEIPTLGGVSLSETNVKKRIQVIVRIRPIEATATRTTALLPDGRTLRIVSTLAKGAKEKLDQGRLRQSRRELEVSFDRVFGESAKQEDIYSQIRACVRLPFSGVNACVFAYGQTGSGKTYSMVGDMQGYSDPAGVVSATANNFAAPPSEGKCRSDSSTNKAKAVEPTPDRCISESCASLRDKHRLGVVGERAGVIPRAVEDIFRIVSQGGVGEAVMVAPVDGQRSIRSASYRDSIGEPPNDAAAAARPIRSRNRRTSRSAPNSPAVGSCHSSRSSGSSTSEDLPSVAVPSAAQWPLSEPIVYLPQSQNQQDLPLYSANKVESPHNSEDSDAAEIEEGGAKSEKLKGCQDTRVVENTISNKYTVECSYMQVYNGRVYDLLSPRSSQKRPLLVLASANPATATECVGERGESAEKNINVSMMDVGNTKTPPGSCMENGGATHVVGLSVHAVDSPEQVMELLQLGARNRRVRSTEMNTNSSRSHTIVQFTISVTSSTRSSARMEGAPCASSGGDGGAGFASDKHVTPTRRSESAVHHAKDYNERRDAVTNNGKRNGVGGTWIGELSCNSKSVGDCSGEAKATQSQGNAGSKNSVMTTRAKLSLVDLAGSERGGAGGEVEKKGRGLQSQSASQSSNGDPTQGEGEREAEEKERVMINSSLHALSNCISSLGEGRRVHVPFRDNPLTRILQDTLVGGRTVVIATISPSVSSQGESISTINFAARCMRVVASQRVNEVLSDALLLERAMRQISALRRRLVEAEAAVAASSCPRPCLRPSPSERTQEVVHTPGSPQKTSAETTVSPPASPSPVCPPSPSTPASSPPPTAGKVENRCEMFSSPDESGSLSVSDDTRAWDLSIRRNEQTRSTRHGDRPAAITAASREVRKPRRSPSGVRVIHRRDSALSPLVETRPPQVEPPVPVLSGVRKRRKSTAALEPVVVSSKGRAQIAEHPRQGEHEEKGKKNEMGGEEKEGEAEEGHLDSNAYSGKPEPFLLSSLPGGGSEVVNSTTCQRHEAHMEEGLRTKMIQKARGRKELIARDKLATTLAAANAAVAATNSIAATVATAGIGLRRCVGTNQETPGVAEEGGRRTSLETPVSCTTQKSRLDSSTTKISNRPVIHSTPSAFLGGPASTVRAGKHASRSTSTSTVGREKRACEKDLATEALIERFSCREREILHELETWKSKCNTLAEENHRAKRSDAYTPVTDANASLGDGGDCDSDGGGDGCSGSGGRGGANTATIVRFGCSNRAPRPNSSGRKKNLENGVLSTVTTHARTVGLFSSQTLAQAPRMGGLAKTRDKVDMPDTTPACVEPDVVDTCHPDGNGFESAEHAKCLGSGKDSEAGSRRWASDKDPQTLPEPGKRGIGITGNTAAGGCSSTEYVRGAEMAVEEDGACGGREVSLGKAAHVSILPPQRGQDAMLQQLGSAPPPEMFNDETKDIDLGVRGDMLHGNGWVASTCLPNLQTGGATVDQVRDGMKANDNRCPTGNQHQPRREAAPEQVFLAGDDASRWSIEGDELGQGIAQVDSPLKVEPNGARATLVSAPSTAAFSRPASTLPLPSPSATTVRNLDSVSSEMKTFPGSGGLNIDGTHICERHGLVGCTLCGTRAEGSLVSSGANMNTTQPQQYVETAPVNDSGVHPHFIDDEPDVTRRIAGRGSDFRGIGAAHSLPHHETGDDLVQGENIKDTVQREQQTKPVFAQPTNKQGRSTQTTARDPCDRHLLLDCILCRILSPAEHVEGASTSVLASASTYVQEGKTYNNLFGRSTSLPVLSGTTQGGDINATDVTVPTTAPKEAFAAGTSGKTSPISESRISHCERHDLQGCFLCGFRGTDLAMVQGGILTKNNLASDRDLLPPPLPPILPTLSSRVDEDRTGRTLIPGGSPNQTLWGIKGATLSSSGSVFKEKGFPVVVERSTSSSGNPNSRPVQATGANTCDELATNEGVNTGVGGSADHTCESLDGIKRAEESGDECTNGTATDGRAKPGGRCAGAADADRRARRHRSRGGTPRRRRLVKPSNSIRSRSNCSGYYSGSTSLSSSSNSGVHKSIGFGLLASNGSRSTTRYNDHTKQEVRSTAQAHTAASATRVREIGDDFTSKAMTAALAELQRS